MKVEGRRLVLGASGAVVTLFAIGLGLRAFPLGVPGEWERTRISARPPSIDVMLGALGVAAYALAAAWLAPRSGSIGRGPMLCRLLALVPMGLFVQIALLWAAPLGYGLSRWASLAMPGSSGYFEVARQEAADLGSFLESYPDWIKRQDALHIGTHPPGLFVWSHLARRIMTENEALAVATLRATPSSAQAGFRELIVPFPANAERAAIVLTASLTMLLCVCTCLPLYFLSRAYLDERAAWFAATLWPLVPSAVMFHPTADTAYPFASALALAFAAWSGRSSRGSLWLACAAGGVLGLALQLTLAFLAVGLVVGLILAGPERDPRRWAVRLLATGAGFLATTLLLWAASRANPFVIWWVNQQNHARFYQEFPRSYLAWLTVNPLELAVGLGLPATCALIAAFACRVPGRAPAALSLLVMALLTVSGRSLSEVARLWLPLMPPLLAAVGGGLDSLCFKRGHHALLLLLMGAQILTLETWIQVVYPVVG